MSTLRHPAPRPRRLSALLVNFNSGSFALSCIRSLKDEWTAMGQAADQLEIVVVDNASTACQAQAIQCMESQGVRVLSSSKNLGFAGGVELALKHSWSEPDLFVLMLNPDVFLLPGCLASLMERLEADPGVGAVAPRCFVDEHRTLFLPPVRRPRPSGEFMLKLAETLGQSARWTSRLQRRRALRSWTAVEPQEMDMLAGACILLQHRTLRSLDCLLDESYPLYFEDADLACRLQQLGLRLELVPAAEALHHWSRSAGAGSDFEGEPRRRWRISQSVYQQRWFSWPARLLLAGLDALAQRVPSPLRGSHRGQVQNLGPVADSLVLELPGEGEFLIELSVDPSFSLCAGSFVTGPQWAMEPGTFSWLFEGQYFLRVSKPETDVILKSFRFQKTSPGRAHGLLESPPARTQRSSLDDPSPLHELKRTA